MCNCFSEYYRKHFFGMTKRLFQFRPISGMSDRLIGKLSVLLSLTFSLFILGYIYYEHFDGMSGVVNGAGVFRCYES